MDPSCSLTFYARGSMYLKRGHHAEALADMNECIRINEKWGTPFLCRGDIYIKMKDYQNGLNSYRKAEEIYKKQGNTKMQKVARKACESVFSTHPIANR